VDRHQGRGDEILTGRITEVKGANSKILEKWAILRCQDDRGYWRLKMKRGHEKVKKIGGAG